MIFFFVFLLFFSTFFLRFWISSFTNISKVITALAIKNSKQKITLTIIVINRDVIEILIFPNRNFNSNRHGYQFWRGVANIQSPSCKTVLPYFKKAALLLQNVTIQRFLSLFVKKLGTSRWPKWGQKFYRSKSAHWATH